MKKKIKTGLLIVILFAAMPSIAQTFDRTSASQLKLLLQLKGFWEAKTAVMKMGEKEYTFPYYADFKATANNNGILMNEWCNIPGIGELDGSNLAGVNPYDGKVHWFSVDNMGTAHEHIGEFSDERHFSMLYNGLQEDKEYVETIVIELTGMDKLNFKIATTLDGKEIETITATFRRKPGKSSK